MQRRQMPPLQSPPLFSQHNEVPGEFAMNMRWLQTHWADYQNKWVALDAGKLLVSGDTYEDIKPYVVNHPNVLNVMRVHIGYDYVMSEEK